jgi:hypothetical protein
MGIKRPGCETDHSHPSNVEVKNAWSYTSTPNTPSWRGAQLKHRNNFTFTLPTSSGLQPSGLTTKILYAFLWEDNIKTNMREMDEGRVVAKFGN